MKLSILSISGALRILLLATMTVSFVGCDDPEEVLKRLTVKLDPAMSSGDRRALAEDISKIMNFRIDARGDRMFQAAFGSNDSSGVVRYLDERINYIVPGSIRLDSRLSTRLTVPVVDEDFIGLVASNLGTNLWMAQEAMRPARLGFQLGGQWIPIRSSRVGIIRLGSAYRQYERMNRIKTLVHEARHSDCTGGLTQADVAQFRAGQPLVNRSCGHEHSICPNGHQYAGYPACDSTVWGAYAIEALYMRNLARCSNCSSEERQVAMAVSLEALNRVVGVDRRAMMAGRLGAPDMRSQGMLGDAAKSEIREFREVRSKTGKTGDSIRPKFY